MRCTKDRDLSAYLVTGHVPNVNISLFAGRVMQDAQSRLRHDRHGIWTRVFGAL
ncbi:MAG: hypothetical protein MK160_00050 [Rhodobacteraceae bacterium]|nr:hypothetical protein [Paracoccaceae bacterium]